MRTNRLTSLLYKSDVTLHTDSGGMNMGPRHPNGYAPLPENAQYGGPGYSGPHPSSQAGYHSYTPGPGQQSLPSIHSSNQPPKMHPGYAYSSGEGLFVIF